MGLALRGLFETVVPCQRGWVIEAGEAGSVTWLKDGVGHAAGKLTLCDWRNKRLRRQIQRICSGLAVREHG